MSSAKRILTLDGFRGIFALLIIIDHADNHSLIFQNFFVQNFDYFVDYFFVLSGFVISYNYADKIKSFISFKDFMLRRMIRLYPLLLYTTLLFFALMIIGKHFGTFRDPYVVLFFQLTDTLTMMNSNPIFGTSLDINYPSWSISSEMTSYALFGFCLFAFKKRSTVILSICLAAAGFFLLYTGRYIYEGDYGFIRGLFCFIMGYFVYLISRRVVTKKFGTLSELLFISMLLLIFKFLPTGYAIVLPCVFAVGIFIFLNGTGIITGFLESKPIQFLGKISFSVYLNHVIIIVVVNKVIFDIMGLDQSNTFNNIIYVLILVFLTIFYSYVTNKYIENATGDLLKKRLIKKPARSLAVEPVLSTNENTVI